MSKATVPHLSVVMCMRSKVMTGFITFPVQNTPWSRVECAISPLLRWQKPLCCLFSSLSLFHHLSVLLFLSCFIYLLFLSLFHRLACNLSLPVTVRGEWRPSAALLPSDIWRRVETQRPECAHARARAHTHKWSLLYRKQCRKKKRQEIGWSKGKERGHRDLTKV